MQRHFILDGGIVSMKIMKQSVIVWTLALVMAFGWIPGNIIAYGAEAGTPKTGDIVVLYTNDVHCAVDQVNKDGVITNMGYASVAAYKEEMESLVGSNYVTLVDAGDALQGDAIGTLSQGQYLVDIMNQVGYDIFVPGNHEFDYGMDRMQELMSDMDAKVVSSNFFNLSKGNLVYAPYQIVTYGSGDIEKKVAYVGITTPESFTKSTPSYFQDDNGNYIYGFGEGNQGQELYDMVQNAVNQAIKNGADYVVAVGHLGIDVQSSPWRSLDVIQNTTGIDAFIDGHSHSTVSGQIATNKNGDDVILTQTGTKLANIGQMTIHVDGSIDTQLISGYEKQNSANIKFINNIEADFADDLAQTVGKTDVVLTILNPDTANRMVRRAETNLGDLCADAYRHILGNGKSGVEAGPADIAFVNGGGVRANIDDGEISFGQVIAVHPFNNVGCVVSATGQEIIDALEMGARMAPEENGGFLQVSGLTYTIDESIASSVVVDEKKNFVSVDGTRRVSDVLVGGVPIDLQKTYTLASHNYMLLSGGDGINMFQDNELVVQPVLLDNQILINYIQHNLKGIVDTDYDDPYGQGRIVINHFSDTSSHWAMEAVDFVVERGLFSGASTTLFSPNNSMTRGMLVTVLYRMEGEPESGTLKFDDVSKEKYYANAIAWASENGIASGTGNQFMPNNLMTREEFAVMLYRYATPDQTVGVLSQFPDQDQVSSWANDAMGWAVEEGIITGDAKGNLNPQGNATRGEVATMLMRYFINQ